MSRFTKYHIITFRMRERGREKEKRSELQQDHTKKISDEVKERRFKSHDRDDVPTLTWIKRVTMQFFFFIARDYIRPAYETKKRELTDIGNEKCLLMDGWKHEQIGHCLQKREKQESRRYYKFWLSGIH